MMILRWYQQFNNVFYRKGRRRTPIEYIFQIGSFQIPSVLVLGIRVEDPFEYVDDVYSCWIKMNEHIFCLLAR